MFRPWKGVLSVALVLAALPAGRAMAQSPDVTAPTISVVTPAEDAVYTQGQPVIAVVLLHRDVGAACAGPVANGAAISTATVGSFQFKVDATDSDGSVARHPPLHGRSPDGRRRGGDTPATLNLTLGTPTAFAPFIPGVAQGLHDDAGRDAHCPRPRTRRCRSPTRARRPPGGWSTARSRCAGAAAGQRHQRQRRARPAERPVGGSAAPTKLLTYGGPLAAEPRR